MSFHSLREPIPTSQYKTSRALREALDCIEGHLVLWPDDDRAEVVRHALLAIIETRCPEFLPRHRKLFVIANTQA